MRPPCKNCPDRVLRCHSSCERYLEYRKIVDKVKKASNENKEIDSFLGLQSFRLHNNPRRKRKR